HRPLNCPHNHCDGQPRFADEAIAVDLTDQATDLDRPLGIRHRPLIQQSTQFFKTLTVRLQLRSDVPRLGQMRAMRDRGDAEAENLTSKDQQRMEDQMLGLLTRSWDHEARLRELAFMCYPTAGVVKLSNPILQSWNAAWQERDTIDESIRLLAGRKIEQRFKGDCKID